MSLDNQILSIILKQYERCYTPEESTLKVTWLDIFTYSFLVVVVVFLGCMCVYIFVTRTQRTQNTNKTRHKSKWDTKIDLGTTQTHQTNLEKYETTRTQNNIDMNDEMTQSIARGYMSTHK